MNYRDYNDNELLMYVEEQSEDANTILYEKYKPLVISTAKKYYYPNYNLGIELSDLIQEGFLGLDTAIHHYNSKNDNKFSTFAKKCIERNIVSLIVKVNRKKHKILNESLSFNSYLDDNETVMLQDFLLNKEEDPLTKVIYMENKKEIAQQIKNILSDLEQEVFFLKIGGLTSKQIALKIGKNIKSVNNTLDRIRKKIRKEIVRT